jgi:hypothetical protein
MNGRPVGIRPMEVDRGATGAERRGAVYGVRRRPHILRASGQIDFSERKIGIDQQQDPIAARGTRGVTIDPGARRRRHRLPVCCPEPDAGSRAGPGALRPSGPARRCVRHVDQGPEGELAARRRGGRAEVNYARTKALQAAMDTLAADTSPGRTRSGGSTRTRFAGPEPWTAGSRSGSRAMSHAAGRSPLRERPSSTCVRGARSATMPSIAWTSALDLLEGGRNVT